jgi:hypothetical protein
MHVYDDRGSNKITDKLIEPITFLSGAVSSF